jgi:DNA-directed RNA polymerase specialized sigma24 family protein
LNGCGTQQPDFAEFYRSAADECLRAVVVSTGDQDAARELVDEAFARAWASWRAASRHPAPKAWVVRTALNASIRTLPLAGRRRPRSMARWRWGLGYASKQCTG